MGFWLKISRLARASMIDPTFDPWPEIQTVERSNGGFEIYMDWARLSRFICREAVRIIRDFDKYGHSMSPDVADEIIAACERAKQRWLAENEPED